MKSLEKLRSLCDKSKGEHGGQAAATNVRRSDGMFPGSAASSLHPSGSGSASASISSDGLYDVELESVKRFTDDDRLHEVCRMLTSSRPVYLKIDKPAELSELEYRHKQQLRLLVLFRRSFATCLGRGMITMDSLEPLVAEALPIPPLSLSGRVPPNNTVVPLETLVISVNFLSFVHLSLIVCKCCPFLRAGSSTANADMVMWPEFHNGVAAALRVERRYVALEPRGRRTGSKITRNWIVYNRTVSQSKAGQEPSHAGILCDVDV